MGRSLRAVAVAVASAALACAACAHGGLDGVHIVHRGALAYGVAAAPGGRIAAIELTTSFELVLRGEARPALPGEGRSPRIAGPEVRVPLGDSTYDIVAVSLDAAGALAAVASLDGTVRLHDARTGAERARWHLDSAATATALSPDGIWLATGSATGNLCLRRARDGALAQCLAAYQKALGALAFSADGGLLASAAEDGNVTIWEMPELRAVERRQADRPGGAVAVAFAPDGGVVAIGAAERIELWSFREGRVRVMRGHDGPITGLTFTPDGATLASVSRDRTLRLWDVKEGRERARIGPFPAILRGVAATADGRALWIAGWSGLDPDGASLSRVDLPYPPSP